jgi:hypothetical protein
MFEFHKLDKGGYYILSVERRDDYFINYYDASIKKQYTVPIDYKVDKNTYVKFRFISNKLFMISYKIHKKVLSAYLQEVDLNSGKLIGEMKEVARLDQVENEFAIYELTLYTSTDKNKLVFFFEHKVSKKENPVYEIIVLNSKHEKESQKKITLPIENRVAKLRNILVANSGDVHLLIAADQDAKTPFFQVLTISPNSDIAILREVPFNSNQIPVHMGLQMNPHDENLIYTGFYKEKDKNEIKGAIMCIFNKQERTPILTEISDFTPDFIQRLADFELNEIITFKNGSVCMVGEQFRIDFLPDNKSAGGTRKRYTKGDIIVVKFAADGKMSFAMTLPKRVVSMEGYTTSYFLLESSKEYHYGNDMGGKLHFYYDKEKNEGTLTSFEDAKLVEATVDAKGDYRNRDIFYTKDLKLISDFDLFGYMNGKVVVYAMTRGVFKMEYCFGTLTPSP